MRLYLSTILMVALFASSHTLVSGFRVLHRTNFRDNCIPLPSSSDDTFSTSSGEFAIDPASVKAKEIMNRLGLTMLQHKQLSALATLVVDWNGKINLISRKDCCKEVVFGRHIVPSLAPLGFKEDPIIQDGMRVVDVGTGGGFPGLPLAIAYPNVQFLLVDSVGKKLAAVNDMAKTLKLNNVKIHHGRAEILEEKDFDVCVGRSVAAIPTYCFWIQNLLKAKDGRLLYLIGGEIEDELLNEAVIDREIDDLLGCPDASDKRVLVFPQTSVKKIARNSGEKVKVPIKKSRTFGSKKKQKSKGQWAKRDNSAPKERGYEGFKRFDSFNSESR